MNRMSQSHPTLIRTERKKRLLRAVEGSSGSAIQLRSVEFSCMQVSTIPLNTSVSAVKFNRVQLNTIEFN